MTDYGVPPEETTTAPSLEKSPEAARSLSPLERMKQERSRSLEKMLHYRVEGREGMVLKFTNIIDPEDLKRYQRNAQGRKKRPEDADNVLAAAQVLQEASRGIYIDGKLVASEDGSEWTLSHNEFIAMYGDMGAPEAIKILLGGPQLLSMADTLVSAAGYGADIETVDPTKP